MKVILPLAGFGKRMRPHTWSKPKPLLSVAGKTVLAHVLDYVLPLGVDEVVFIVGWLGDQIREYVATHYADAPFKARFVEQTELKGQAHAVYLAKEYVHGPCLFTWVDTLFRADLSGLDRAPADVVAFTIEAEDPRPFGVAVEQDGRVVRLIEKPPTCEFKQVVVGVYYVAEGEKLIDAIAHLMAQNMQTKGEFYLADAFNVMLARGATMITRPVSVWEDCGVPETLLHTNRFLLENGHSHEIPTQHSVLIPPVYVAPSAQIENSVVGPYVSIGEGVRLKNVIVRDAIIEEGAVLENSLLERSLIGSLVQMRGAMRQVSLGADSTDLPSEG
ncbi:MAG: sugar phosphate nucleotidyltransferase [Chloroflexota bacterium]